MLPGVVEIDQVEIAAVHRIALDMRPLVDGRIMGVPLAPLLANPSFQRSAVGQREP